MSDYTSKSPLSSSTSTEAMKETLKKDARQLREQSLSFAADPQKKSASDLAHDAQQLAKENPTGFLLGSIALRFGLSRFAKASTTASSSVPLTRTPL